MSILDKLFGKKERTAAEIALSGEYLLSQKKLNQALKEFNTAISMEPENDLFYFSRSKVKKEMKNYEAAMEDIDYALKLQPEVKIYQNFKNEIIKAKI